MIRRFATLLRLEALSLLRTSEAYTFGILPATLLVPAVVVGALLAMSFRSEPVLALPLEDPPALAPSEGLDDRWTLSRAADPAAEVTAGRAALAVTSWREGPPDGPLLVVEAVGDPDQVVALRSALARWADRDLDRRVEDAGGDPDRDRRVASIARPTVVSNLDRITPRFALVAFGAFLAGYLGCFVVPVRTTAERLSGTLEAMAVSPMPLAAVFAARVVVAAGFTGLVTALPFLSMLMLSWSAGADTPELHALDVAEFLAVLLVFDAAFVLCGLAANSVRMSLYFSSYAILLASPAAGLPLWRPVPWLPVAGLATHPDVGHQLGRIGLAVAVAVGLVLVAGWVARLDRALPPAGAGE